MGEITLFLEKDTCKLTFVIQDNGPGIDTENMERIFERFYTDRADTDGFGQNSGLGLSISKQIIEAHNGKIYVENRKDGIHGARFVIELPLDIAKSI